jgi:DNA-binding protein H-NS
MTKPKFSALKAKIQKEIERLQKQAKALHNKERTPVIRSIIKSMKDYDITPEDIALAYNKRGNAKALTPKSALRTGGTRGPVPPKYRHPETGATWTGRGKAPKWVVDAETTGQGRDQFLITRP